MNLWTDEEARTALEALFAGKTNREAAALVGRSHNSAIGFFRRCREESDAIPCMCKKPENRDGGGL